jgi:hypothetical protein
MSRFSLAPARPALSFALMVAALLGTAAGLVEGAPTGDNAGGGRRGPPPAEALAACKSQASGAACTFQHEGRSLSGSCWAPPERPLACRPKDAPMAGGAAGKAR